MLDLPVTVPRLQDHARRLDTIDRGGGARPPLQGLERSRDELLCSLARGQGALDTRGVSPVAPLLRHARRGVGALEVLRGEQLQMPRPLGGALHQLRGRQPQTRALCVTVAVDRLEVGQSLLESKLRGHVLRVARQQRQRLEQPLPLLGREGRRRAEVSHQVGERRGGESDDSDVRGGRREQLDEQWDDAGLDARLRVALEADVGEEGEATAKHMRVICCNAVTKRCHFLQPLLLRESVHDDEGVLARGGGDRFGEARERDEAMPP